MRRFIEHKPPNPFWFRYNAKLLEYIDIDINNNKVFVKYRIGHLYEEADSDFAGFIIPNLEVYITSQSIIEVNYIKETPFINIYDFL